MDLRLIFENARKAAFENAQASADLKNECLEKTAQNLILGTDEIICENKKDMQNAKNAGMSQSMLDRLTLDSARIRSCAESLLKVKALSDPIGTGSVVTRPNGLVIRKMCVPIGVVGIIYEARPNVTADAAGLCIKTGNACILRGGKEAINTNIAIESVIRRSAEACGMNPFTVQLLHDTSRESSNALMKANGFIDVLIPRGGKGLIKSVVENATVPVIETGAGNCHVYVDESADYDMAVNIVINAKTQRPSVCNAAESLLVAQSVAKEFLPIVYKSLKQKNVELRGCEKTLEILPDIKKATEQDFYQEYNDLIMSVKVVKDVKEAVEHINKHSTGHSEAIVTQNQVNARYFTANVDSAAVYVNASTRFTDGEEFGFGAEIGISTQKLHARGPMGLQALTTSKYIVEGSGQIRG